MKDIGKTWDDSIQEHELYFMACEYMAKTELYDRTLTDCRCRWDKTSAFPHTHYQRALSLKYAKQLRKYYSEFCEGTFRFIHDIIQKHPMYTAQMWIDEYNRLKEEDKGTSYDI